VPIAVTPDQVALQASIRDWARQAGPLAAVRRLQPGGPAEPAAWTTCLGDMAATVYAEGEASYEFLLTRCLSIAGGTTQILLSRVAERVLGLPR
jgi:hypothetical protein